LKNVGMSSHSLQSNATVSSEEIIEILTDDKDNISD